jgi:hypothetical protein
MTKFASFIAAPAANKGALDDKAIKTIEEFLDGLEGRYTAAKNEGEHTFIWVVQEDNPRMIIELGDEPELKAAFRRWCLRPFDLGERLEADGYPMRDIRYLDETNEVRIWLKK